MTWKETVRKTLAIHEGVVCSDIRRGNFRHAGFIFTIETVLVPPPIPPDLENRKALWKNLSNVMPANEGFAFSLDKAFEFLDRISKLPLNEDNWSILGWRLFVESVEGESLDIEWNWQPNTWPGFLGRFDFDGSFLGNR
jgi:hypothetical protein